MNQSNKIRIRFSIYLIYWYIWLSLKLKFVFFTTKSSRTGHKSDNFYDIKKPVRILLDDLIKKKYTTFRFDENCFTYATSRFEKHGFEKINRHSHYVTKKLPNKFFIHFEIYIIKTFDQISFKNKFLLRKISKIRFSKSNNQMANDRVSKFQNHEYYNNKICGIFSFTIFF